MTEDATKPDDITCPEGFFKGVKYFLIGNIDKKVRNREWILSYFDHADGMVIMLIHQKHVKTFFVAQVGSKQDALSCQVILH